MTDAFRIKLRDAIDAASDTPIPHVILDAMVDSILTTIDPTGYIVELKAENERLRESVRVFASAYYQAPYVSQQQDKEP